MSNIRNSGIPQIGDVTQGTQICQFYSSFKDSLELLPNYFNQGILANELVVWIIPSSFPQKYAVEFLQKYILNITNMIDEGRFIISYDNDIYFTKTWFDPKKTLKFRDFIHTYIKTNKFTGLRTAASINFLRKEDFSKFQQYEEDSAKTIIDSPVIALCQYNDLTFNTYEVATIVRNYKVCLVKRQNNWISLKNTETEIIEKNSVLKDLELKNLRSYVNDKFDFLSNLSHDFKTPLNIILSSIQLIELKSMKKIESGHDLRYLNIMKQNCNHILHLVDNIIDLDKSQTGNLKTNFTSINLVALVEEISSRVEDYIHANQLSLSLKKHLKKTIVECDPVQIERILLNLISNAVKHSSPNGRITISLTSTSPSSSIHKVLGLEHKICDEKMVIISVKDTGCGISPEKQAHIFEKFVQEENLPNQDLGGSGIGLSLVKALVENHRGFIQVKSFLGEGSEFIVALPLSQKNKDSNTQAV
jgi:signal transduction histidine kinase